MAEWRSSCTCVCASTHLKPIKKFNCAFNLITLSIIRNVYNYLIWDQQFVWTDTNITHVMWIFLTFFHIFIYLHWIFGHLAVRVVRCTLVLFFVSSNNQAKVKLGTQYNSSISSQIIATQFYIWKNVMRHVQPTEFEFQYILMCFFSSYKYTQCEWLFWIYWGRLLKIKKQTDCGSIVELPNKWYTCASPNLSDRHLNSPIFCCCISSYNQVESMSWNPKNQICHNSQKIKSKSDPKSKNADSPSLLISF